MRRAILVLPLLAGLAAAIVLTMPSAARAWDIHSLPDGYTIVGHIKNGDCTTYQIRGYSAAVDLSDCRPDFQEALDAFVESTCPQTVCHPVTTTATPTTAPPVTTAPSTLATTTTTAPVDTTTASIVTVPPVTTVVTVPAATSTTVTTTPTETVTQTVTTPATTQTVTLATNDDTAKLQAQIDLINQRIAAHEARIAALEHPTGQILGEPKNMTPFVNETSP